MEILVFGVLRTEEGVTIFWISLEEDKDGDDSLAFGNVGDDCVFSDVAVDNNGKVDFDVEEVKNDDGDEVVGWKKDCCSLWEMSKNRAVLLPGSFVLVVVTKSLDVTKLGL